MFNEIVMYNWKVVIFIIERRRTVLQYVLYVYTGIAELFPNFFSKH